MHCVELRIGGCLIVGVGWGELGAGSRWGGGGGYFHMYAHCVCAARGDPHIHP